MSAPTLEQLGDFNWWQKQKSEKRGMALGSTLSNNPAVQRKSFAFAEVSHD